MTQLDFIFAFIAFALLEGAKIIVMLCIVGELNGIKKAINDEEE